MSSCNDDFPPVIDDLPVPPKIPDGVNTATVTEGCVDGAGIYDVFMRVHMDAIQQEYKKNRIIGPEYAQVYLGGMQAAMAQAVGFALGKDEAAAKAELARYAIQKSQYDILTSQAGLVLIGEQICKVQKEIELMTAQRELLAAQTWAEIAKTTPEVDVYMGQLLQESPLYTGPGAELNAVTGEQHLNRGSAIGAQVSKTQRERNLLATKELVEQAQISDKYAHRYDDGSKRTEPDNTVSVTGTVLKEKNLLQRQADGFLRDAEAKVAKIATDAFSVQYSTADGDIGQGTGWDNLDALWNALNTAIGNTANAEHTEDEIDENS